MFIIINTTYFTKGVNYIYIEDLEDLLILIAFDIHGLKFQWGDLAKSHCLREGTKCQTHRRNNLARIKILLVMSHIIYY